MRDLLTKFVIRPLRLVVSNVSVLLLVLIVILLDEVNKSLRVSTGQNIGISLMQTMSSAWAFEQLPNSIIGLNISWWIPFATLTIFFVQSAVTVIVMTDLKLIYSGQHSGLLHTLSNLNKEGVAWYFIWVTLVYLLSGCIALLFYAPCYLIWQAYRISLIVPLYFIAALIFPFLYSLLSIGAKVAVIPSAWTDKFLKMKSLLTVVKLLRIYLFYPIRLALEFACLFIAPVIALSLFNNRIAALVIGGLALIIPLAAFRASTFELFLDLFAQDRLVQEIFRRYYESAALEVSRGKKR